MTYSVCTAKWIISAHGPRPQRDFRAQLVRPRVPLAWAFGLVLPKDLVPLVGFKVRVLGFRPRDRILMEQGLIIARALLAMVSENPEIRSKVRATDRSSD